MRAKVRQVWLVTECGYQPKLWDLLLPQTLLTDRFHLRSSRLLTIYMTSYAAVLATLFLALLSEELRLR